EAQRSSPRRQRMALFVIALLVLVISKRCRVRPAESQIPALLQVAPSRKTKGWNKDLVFLAVYIVAADFSDALSDAAFIRRINRTANGHVENAIWAEQQRLCSSTIP